MPPIPASLAASIIEAERLIGRSFNQKTLLLEALTLSSGSSQFHVDSYQRLEFLGDAVLDLIVMTRLFRNQQSTNTLTQVQDALEYGDSYPWEPLLALHPAKFQSDMIESVISAILVDSGGQLQPCEDFLTRIGLIEYLERLVGENIDDVHPRDPLQQLSGSRKVIYNVKSEGSKRFRGELMVDGVVRARADECSSKALVTASLARMGIERLLIKHVPGKVRTPLQSFTVDNNSVACGLKTCFVPSIETH
ncbi:Dicer-like protein 2 [Friedmanniomyces endolithicus]|nr:Dicer-like protein 2 [Friedmanniomyces endolithicus]